MSLELDLNSFKPPLFGLDEVGRGCLAGPVVGAAATLKTSESQNINLWIDEALDQKLDWVYPLFKNWKDQLTNKEKSTSSSVTITDSKALSPQKRDQILPLLFSKYSVCLSAVSAFEIDKINILQASLRAMGQASLTLEKKLQNKAQHLLIDGNQKIPNWNGNQTPVIKGDLLCEPIAAASIVAKVFRDFLMLHLGKKYPQYGFEKHKAYPSALHKNKLKEFGPCPEHRLTFKGVLTDINHL